MQVSVETGEGSQRTLKIQVPAETLNQAVENRLKSMSGNVKIDGFRPGKVPLKVIKQRYGGQVFQEVAGEIIQNTYRDALTQEKLNPASEPVINAQSMKLGEPLEYTATFDVITEFVLSPISDLKIERVAAEVADSDIDKMIETLRQQKTVWSAVDQPSADGDRVTISFKGTIDGESFEGGDAEDIPVVIGSGSMISGFEDKLKGLSTGAMTSISTSFPDDYAAVALAGKAVEFAVEVKGVESPSTPEVDEEFAKTFGVDEGGVEKLRDEIRNNMTRELSYRLKTDLKTKVMDQLVENNNIDVPQSIVNSEAEALRAKASDMMNGNAPIENFMDEAKKRVQLGLILGEVIKTASLTITQDAVKERIELMSQDYADAEEFKQHYYSNPELLRSVETVVLEDMAVDWVVDNSTVSEVTLTFDELMNPIK